MSFSSLRKGAVRVAAWALLAAVACAPKMGERVTTESAAPPTVAIQCAEVNSERKVVVTYRLTAGDAGITAGTAVGLRPAFTLAALSTDPVSGIAAWKSHLLSGRQTLAWLPVSGPGTPAEQVLVDTRQPGTDSGGVLEDLGSGRYRYTFGAVLTDLHDPEEPNDPNETLRVGMWLDGATGAAGTSSTFDFVPAGGPPQARDLVLDEQCTACHAGPKRYHGGVRVGVRLCVTCHTLQNADPDTVDPAAMTGATGATDPNPLDLGRLLHRVHRGRKLPTLYQSSSTQPAPPLGSGPLPLPYFPGRNAAVAGSRYAFVGDQSRTFTAGAIVSRTDNGMPAKTVATGIRYPRDLRDCDACHGAAPQASAVTEVVSRRVCAGCHPDVWFGSGATDTSHLAHPGGPQADDSACASCHVQGDRVYAPIAQAHVPPYLHPNYSAITARIASVTGMLPGAQPTVTFTLADRNGPITSLAAPSPAGDALSPVPRKLSKVTITVAGPTAPDYASGNAPLTEVVPLTLVSDASGAFSYTFSTALPEIASGTWSVALEARRTGATVHYTPASDAFGWPYTGEAVTETADNPVVQVDAATGVGPGDSALARRAVVDVETKCNACHGKLTEHLARNQTEYCVMCHTADQTDWGARPKTARGDVNLATVFSQTSYGTYDDVEERSLHFNLLIHRIHTGARRGSAQLDLVGPFVMYSSYDGAVFFDDTIFPGDLTRCTTCHLGKSYQIEALPADSSPTIANETATIQHGGTAAHGAGEPRLLPVTASCVGCHGTGTAALHASKHVDAGVEACATCHGAKGSLSVRAVHGLPDE
jgi:OmcA/MtrC family decaheme c-type cytochrome